MERVLIVDDEDKIRIVFSEILREKGFAPLTAADGPEAIEVFKRDRPDAVLLDLNLPGMDGIETMLHLKKMVAEVPVIIVTAYGDIPTAVEAIKRGAYDFIAKPPDIDRLIVTLRRSLETLHLERTVSRLSAVMESSLEWLLGRSTVMKGVVRQIQQVAWTDFSIIIQGETGTGKSLIANVIHQQSSRAEKPIVSVDLGVLPENLVESELFGYERGAFTGAERRRKGFLEVAHEGTIFIDELENASPYVQSKLLNFVGSKRLYPLGSTEPVDVDIRIITATNKDIRQAVREKAFREDLFYRLGEFVLSVPPLRERGDDIVFLAQQFLVEAARELKKQVKEFSDEAIRLLRGYNWPGNVRELKNIVRRAVLLAGDETVRPEHIDFLLVTEEEQNVVSQPGPLRDVVRQVERKAIRDALRVTKGNKSKAASLLQVDYKTLLTKIKEFNLQ